jgi:hypothetical protein
VEGFFRLMSGFFLSGGYARLQAAGWLLDGWPMASHGWRIASAGIGILAFSSMTLPTGTTLEQINRGGKAASN